MKAFLSILCSALFFIAPLSAQCFSLLPEFCLQAGLGYRHDRAHWKGGSFPEHIKIDDAHIAKVNVGFETSFLSYFLFRAEGDCGWIFSGSGKSNSFNFYDGNSYVLGKDSDVKGDFVYDYSLVLGVNVNPFLPFIGTICPIIKVFPLVGYSYHFQKYHLDPDSSDFSFNFQEVNRYKTRWQGPLLGLGFNLDLLVGFNVRLEYHYQWADFHGSFTLDNNSYSSYAGYYGYEGSSHHSRHGSGNIGRANVRWTFCDGWRVDLGAIIQLWTAKKAKWDAYEFNLNVIYFF